MREKNLGKTLILTLALSFQVDADVNHASKEYEQGHYANALREFVPLAQQGDALAQLGLGKMYDRGHGVQKNLQSAFNWYLKAANQGQRVAQFNIGEMYIRGEGVSEDLGKAAEWLAKSADQDFPLAQFRLGLMYAKGMGVSANPKKAEELVLKAASRGNAPAQYILAMMYSGGMGVPENSKLSAEWALKSANQGMPDAQYFMGTLYKSGLGVPMNQAKADEWFLKAAKQRLPGADNSISGSPQQSSATGDEKKFLTLTEKTKTLWNDLNSFRYDPAFHQYGYMQGSTPGGGWVNRQKALSDECSNYKDKLALEIKSRYNLCGIIQYIWLVGIDWYGNRGKNKSETEFMISQIEKSLKNGGKTTK